MRLIIQLHATHQPAILPINYQYPLASAIYKIIARADEGYASFLHEEGYRYKAKQFKLFTFSDIRTPFTIAGDRLVMKTATASFTICFHIPDAAEHFIRGLFMHQEIVVADKESKVVFNVQQVEGLQVNLPEGDKEVVLQPISPMVVGRKNNRGNYDYLSPEEIGYGQLVANNLIDKYAAIQQLCSDEVEQLKSLVSIVPQYYSKPPRHRLLTLKHGTTEETKVRGFNQFKLKLKAPTQLVQLAMDTGLAMHNAMGFGCVEVVG